MREQKEIVSSHEQIDKEIGRKVSSGRKVVCCMASVARRMELLEGAKMAVHNSVLLPALLCVNESWLCQNKHRS